MHTQTPPTLNPEFVFKTLTLNKGWSYSSTKYGITLKLRYSSLFQIKGPDYYWAFSCQNVIYWWASSFNGPKDEELNQILPEKLKIFTSRPHIMKKQYYTRMSYRIKCHSFISQGKGWFSGTQKTQQFSCPLLCQYWKLQQSPPSKPSNLLRWNRKKSSLYT